MKTVIKEKNTAFQETCSLFNNTDFGDKCDFSCESYNYKEILPPYYDEEKFKRGQQFYHKHIFAMLFGKLLGLVTVISTPTVLNVLSFTNMSSNSLDAYKRYMSTILHMCIWYDNDLTPGSKLWQSIATVKKMHNAASNRSCTTGLRGILQKDMGLTQFGFMGYVIVRPECIGIHKWSKEEQEGFVHLWRVVGYILGIQDKYNICRESLEETKDLCEYLCTKVFLPNIQNQEELYLTMCDALVNGMWVMEPSLNTKVYQRYIHMLLGSTTNNNESTSFDVEPTRWERFLYNLIASVAYYLKYDLVRHIFNAKQRLSFWLMRNFPFLAFYKFSYKNSFVSIYIERNPK